MTMHETFRRQAARYLPGFVYSFNIADLKRRNIHLGHEVGDRDIQDLDRALKALNGATAFAARTGGAEWMLVSRRDMRAQVQAVLDAYPKDEPIWTGWRIESCRKDERATREHVVAAEIRRAVRCLSAAASTPEELDAVLDRIKDNDYNLPVGRIHPLAELPAREAWQCVSRYPADKPACAFCGGQSFKWEDGDGAVYSGSGTCAACGASIDIRQIDEPRPAQAAAAPSRPTNAAALWDYFRLRKP